MEPVSWIEILRRCRLFLLDLGCPESSEPVVECRSLQNAVVDATRLGYLHPTFRDEWPTDIGWIIHVLQILADFAGLEFNRARLQIDVAAMKKLSHVHNCRKSLVDILEHASEENI